MVAVAGHLSLEGLEQGYRTARDGTTARHFEVIRLMAKGHSTADVSELTGFGIRWMPIPMKPPLCSEMIAPPDSGMISPP